MDIKDIAEQAYKNGYENGKQETAEKILKEIAHIEVSYNSTAQIIAFKVTEKLEELAKQFGVVLGE